jgi:hypothetical protein
VVAHVADTERAFVRIKRAVGEQLLHRAKRQLRVIAWRARGAPLA